MARLKAETRDLHVATERTALSRSLVDGTLTAPMYAVLLGFYARIYDALDDALAKDPEVRAVVGEEAAHAARARSDLARLGLPPSSSARLESETSALETLVRESRGARLLGMAYVLEGASLGGAFLAPRVALALGLGDEHVEFFRGAGPRTMDRWRAFGARTNARLSPTLEDGEYSVTGARELFAGIAAAFDAMSEGLRARPRTARTESSDVASA